MIMRAIKTIKEMIRKSPIGDTVARFRHYIVNSVNESLGVRPRIPISKSRLNLIRLGTRYGGWTFVDRENLNRSTIISCGAGEDISFDLLFAQTYNARIIIVDPTPRAVAHVKEVISNISCPEDAEIRPRIDYQGYQIDGLKNEQIVLVNSALWSAEGTLRLFAPPNPAHVSHSALDYQNNYKKEGDFIEVNSITLQKLAEDLKIDEFPLMKLDIEGAEIEVLENLSAADILPDQICVEFDELSKPSRLTARRVKCIHDHLERLGYVAVYKDDVGINFLYVKKDIF